MEDIKTKFTHTKIETHNTLGYHIASVFKSSLITQVTGASFFILCIISLLFQLSTIPALITIVFGTLTIYASSVVLVALLISYETTKEPISKEQRMVFKFDFFHHLLLAKLASFHFDEFSQKLAIEKDELSKMDEIK